MPKKSISSLELAALAQELQFIIGGKIDQIYHQQEKELLLQIHVPRKGKILLRIVPGKFLCQTTKKEVPLRPSSFCMQLRKHLDNANIKQFYQKESERVVVFELEKKETFFLIVELFSKGNIVLADDKCHIMGLLEAQSWKGREVKVGVKYVFPVPAVDWQHLTLKQLEKLLAESKKNSMVTALAIELGLGGTYAEELCLRAEVEKEQKPQELGQEEVKTLFQTLQELLHSIREPRGYFYPENVTSFALRGQTPLRQTATYSEAIDTLNPFLKPSPYEQKIKSIHNMIEAQRESIAKQEEVICENTAKADLIYAHYQPLQRLLAIVKELRETKNWQEIAQELKKEKRIKEVNLKDKTVVVEL